MREYIMNSHPKDLALIVSVHGTLKLKIWFSCFYTVNEHIQFWARPYLIGILQFVCIQASPLITASCQGLA
jgi:hypothetical protein